MFKKKKELFKKVELDESKKDVRLEKGDFLAIAIALSFYMVPALIGVFALIALIVWIIF
ncbi:hypothetical protein SAMN05660462_00870 [Proteiniborus ethanoligenes]|uniref:Uncharacterized protein n=1 Tax=Proteiniborus ethanoligenes TaxID=415015 RepID=A0A1H3MLP6_9FIRM|nr:hypothetical protein [Proteiniborus ethanoligenes]SDY77607.1 hypothetical protein SAMN05660462_00870 [Proteiniborus ethanoligenes]